MEEVRGGYTVRDLLKVLEGVDLDTPIALTMNEEYFWFACHAEFRAANKPAFYGHPRVYIGPMIVMYG